MSYPPAEEPISDDQLLEELLSALGADERADLTALREKYAGGRPQFDGLLHAARLYLAGRDDLRDDNKRTGTLASGTMLGDFEIVTLLGRGGMGEVYRARQHSLGRREVALKVLAIQLRQAKARARFQREALLLAGLHHPGLAEVFGFGEENGEPFLAMRLVEGTDLRSLQREWASRGVAPGEKLTQIIGWGMQVAEALALVHESGLVHRDVKPSNIIIEGDASEREAGGRAVLVDFGLARPVDTESLTLASGSPATLEYAPPEQILGQTVGPSADVFALGVTLHDAITGRVPGERPRAAGGLRSLQEFDSAFDRDLAAVIARAVDPEARWRYPDAGRLHADLLAWRQGKPVSARRRSWKERLERGLKDHPGRVSSMLVGLVLCTLLIKLAVELGTHREAIVEAGDALRAGDLGRASHVVAKVEDSWQVSALGWPEELEDFVKSSRQAPDSSSLARVVQRLDARDINGALYAGAEAMRLRGFEQEPLIFHWWWAGLSEGPGATDVWEREAWTQRLRLTARLLCERPCQTRETMLAAAPLREVLVDLEAQGQLTSEQRLYMLSALSGCGNKSDLPRLVETMLQFPPESEEARLTRAVVDRILRRLTVSDDLKGIDFPQFWRSLAGTVTPVLEPGVGCFSLGGEYFVRNGRTLFERGLVYLVLALSNAERRARKPSLLHTVIPESWWSELELGSAHSLVLLARLGGSADPQVRDALLSLKGLERWELDPKAIGYDLGRIAGLSDDPDFIARARNRCEELRPEGSDLREILAVFDLYVYFCATANETLKLDTNLDADSLLGAPELPTDGWRDLEIKPGEPLGVATFAAWNFVLEAPASGGSATGVRLRSFHRDEDRHARYLIGRRPGISELELIYEGRGLKEGQGRVLRFRHLAARRLLFPYKGQVFLQIRVDGQLIADGLSVACEVAGTPHFESIALPMEALTLGEHTISIRIDPRSTTTYRLLGVELVLE